MEKITDQAFGLPKGTVRGIAFLILVSSLFVMTTTLCIGAAWGPITFANFKEFLLLILPLISMAFGFYFGQKMNSGA